MSLVLSTLLPYKEWHPYLTALNRKQTFTSMLAAIRTINDCEPPVLVTSDRSKVEASKAVVQDISGGCGSMYKIEIESPLFRRKGLVAQHRMVKDALKAEIADMHGLTLHTRPSPE